MSEIASPAPPPLPSVCRTPTAQSISRRPMKFGALNNQKKAFNMTLQMHQFGALITYAPTAIAYEHMLR